MKVSEGSVPQAQEIIDSVLCRIKGYNCFGMCLSHLLMGEDSPTVLIADESVCEQVGNASLKEFRGYADRDEITMFFTRYETVQSMEWLLCHEIGHWSILNSPISHCFANIARQGHYKEAGIYKGVLPVFYEEQDFREEYRKDSVHDSDPEEHFCDLFANAIMGKALGRPWWRQNIIAVDKEQEGAHNGEQQNVPPV